MTTTNGKPSRSARVKEARARLQLRKLRLQAHVLARQERLLGVGKHADKHAHESTAWPGWGPGVDPWQYPDAAFAGMPLGGWVSQPGDRRHGQAGWPVWQNLQQLGAFRQASRLLCRRNAQASGLLKNLTNYLIGTGFKYRAAAKANIDASPDPGQQVDDRTKRLVALVQRVIDRFTGDSDPYSGVTPWGRRERETFRRVPRDGEAYLRLYRLTGPCRVEVRPVGPEQCIDPPGATLAQGWSYGSRHHVESDGSEDVERIEAYYFCYTADPTKGDEVPASDVIHVKNPDEDSDVKRGLPFFYGDVYDAFVRAAKLQRNLSEGAALQAAIAWIEQFETATRAQVQEYQDAQTDFRRPNPYSQTGAEQGHTYYAPGSIPKIPKGKAYVQAPYNAGAGAQQAIVQGDLRQGIAAACAPEFFSGDASNNNYASIQMAGSPIVKAAVADQGYYAGYFARAVWASVLWAVECGELPREALAVVRLLVEPPQVLHEDPLQQAQTDQIHVGIGAKSPQIVSQELGLDPAQVLADIVARQDELGTEGPPLPLPGEEGGEPKADPFGESVHEADQKGGQFKKGGGHVQGKGGQDKPSKSKGKSDEPAKAKGTAVEPGAHPGATHGSTVTVKPTKQRAFEGQPVATKTTLTKQETGRVGEAVVTAYLRHLGYADAGPMNSTRTNFPIDLIEDHAPTEVKAGLCSNSKGAQQWRLTFSKESAAETALYETMTPTERESWNAEKQQRIHERKEAAIKALAKAFPGKKIKPRTMTVIVNPDTRTADVYEFDGFHDRIGWNTPEAKKAYKGSVTYG